MSAAYQEIALRDKYITACITKFLRDLMDIRILWDIMCLFGELLQTYRRIVMSLTEGQTGQ
jgi:hypothetical protein